VIEPIWEQRFIFDSYANRVGKGTHRALDRVTQFARRYPFVLQCDVRQFFPSIDHAILRAELGRRIADPRALWLCERILESGAGANAQEYTITWFPGDDLLAPLRPRGLPIGNLTSQFWANVYLNPFDHFVKRKLKSAAYVRFVDDFLLFAESKRTLQAWRAAVIDYLAGLRLALHEERAQVYPTGAGIPFLGFRVYPAYRRLKRSNALKCRRRLRRLLCEWDGSAERLARLQASIRGWINHSRYGNTWGLRRAILGRIHL
jgi:retron-type reverse transcriptase